MAESMTNAMLGGLVGGFIAANTVRRLPPDVHRIVLIEKAFHAFALSFLD